MQHKVLERGRHVRWQILHGSATLDVSVLSGLGERRQVVVVIPLRTINRRVVRSLRVDVLQR
jgi:hypothetical protein